MSSKYTLPSGIASIEKSGTSILAESEYIYPMTKTEICLALQEALTELVKLSDEIEGMYQDAAGADL